MSLAARALDAVLLFRWLTESRPPTAENVAEALAVMTMLTPAYLDVRVVEQLRALAATSVPSSCHLPLEGRRQRGCLLSGAAVMRRLSGPVESRDAIEAVFRGPPGRG